MAAAACWLTIGVGALLFAIGLMEQIYFEPTEEALASATTGRWRMLVGVIVATAGLTANYHRRRHQP